MAIRRPPLTGRPGLSRRAAEGRTASVMVPEGLAKTSDLGGGTRSGVRVVRTGEGP